MIGSCSTNERGEKCTQNFDRNIEGRKRHIQDIGVNGKYY
jgi:hypothetical protein